MCLLKVEIEEEIDETSFVDFGEMRRCPFEFNSVEFLYCTEKQENIGASVSDAYEKSPGSEKTPR